MVESDTNEPSIQLPDQGHTRSQGEHNFKSSLTHEPLSMD